MRINIEQLNERILKSGTTKEALADEIGVDRSTLYRRLKNGTLRIGDVHRMCDVLNLSAEEAISIFLPR